MTDALSLAGKVAFVSGGTRGIGLACARALAESGAAVVVSGRTLGSAQAAAQALAAETGALTLGLACDNAAPDEISSAYRRIHEELKGLDVLVNNAGVMEGALIGMIAPEFVDRTFDVNVRGSLLHLQGAARLIRRRGGGSIINLTSILGLRGKSGQSVYAASKAAVVGATLAAAKELAPSRVRVNAVAPGFIDTDLTRALSDQDRESTLASIAMGRPGTPGDVAGTVLFLASDLSSYVTGQVIGVDGGMLV